MSSTLAAAITSVIELLKSHRNTELSPPSQLFTARVTHEVDPIFTPRDYPYNDKEREYIRSLSPFPSLPLSLIPTDRNPYPPLMLYGWVISESLKEQLLRAADSVDHNYVKRSGPSLVNESLSFDLGLCHILKELGVSWSSDQYIHLADTKFDSDGALFFNLYTNHDLGHLPYASIPSKEDIERIRSYLQLTESPTWYSTALDFEWRDDPPY